MLRWSSCLGVGLALLLHATAASAAPNCIWTGAAASPNWSANGNWTADCASRAPQNGDILTFTAHPMLVSFTSVNDIPGLQPSSIVITSPNFAISGAGVLLGGAGLTFNGPVTQIDHKTATFTAPITLNGPLTIANTTNTPNTEAGSLAVGNINLNGFALTLDTKRNTLSVTGSISGAGSITKVNIVGTLTLSGDSSFAGQLVINDGLVVVTHPHALGAAGLGNETVLGNGAPNNTATLYFALGANATVDESFVFRNNGAALQFLETVGPFTTTFTGSIGFPVLDQDPQISTMNVQPDSNSTIVLAGPLIGGTFNVLFPGSVTLSSPAANTWKALILSQSSYVRVGAPGAIPADADLEFGGGTLDLNGFDTTIGVLRGGVISNLVLAGKTLTANIPTPTGITSDTFIGAITGPGTFVKSGPGTLSFSLTNTFTGTLVVSQGTFGLLASVGAGIGGPVIVTGGTFAPGSMVSIADTIPVTVNSPGTWLTDRVLTIGSLAGSGNVFVGNGTLTVGANNSSTTFNGVMTGTLASTSNTLVKVGSGTLTMAGQNTYTGGTLVNAGKLIVDGSLLSSSVVNVSGGALGGSGSVGSIIATTGGAIAPGSSPGILHAASLRLDRPAELDIELNGPTAGSGYDQLDVHGDVNLRAGPPLHVTRNFGPQPGAQFTIVNVAAGHTVTGTFDSLPEGATLDLTGQHFSITYKGGDGNDVVLTAMDHPPPVTYYLSEGATGPFFDEDVLIANPNGSDAPITLTFSKEDGTQVTATQTVPAQAHATVHVDAIAGLEATAASTQVRSEQGLPLVVERTMFWDQSYYAGHTGSAVDRPATDWFFAEGSQGFFSTFVLVINPNATPTDVTFTFLRESETPVTKTITVGASTRLTLDAGTVPEIVNRSFGITVHATQPIMAERSMYFGTTPTRLWSGGTESAGVTAASTHWFLAEGATGGFFDTFILLSNPNDTPAQVTLQYLLDTGDTISVPKTIAAHARLTTNIEAEDDVRLHNAAVSTVVSADVPIIAERSMYWPGAAVPWGEGHNSFGVVDAGTHWGLAEARVGGPHQFHTYILLANPQTTTANVTVTYLREGGATPVVKTYTVPPTSRFNIDTSTVTELQDESFGADIQVTNSIPVIVECSMYWASSGFLFSGGTNATASRLP